jgi:flagellar hook-length control protein FliK
MLKLHISPPRAAPFDAPAQPAHGHNASSDPAGFSSLLRQSQSAAAPVTTPAPTPTAPQGKPSQVAEAKPERPRAQSADSNSKPDAEGTASDVQGNSPEPTAEAANSAPSTSRPGAGGRDKASDPTRPARSSTTDLADGDTLPTAASPTTSTTDAATPAKADPMPAAIDPSLMPWMAALQRPVHDALPRSTDAGTDVGSGGTGAATSATPGDSAAGVLGAPTQPGAAALAAKDKDKTSGDASRFAAAADAAALHAAEATGKLGERGRAEAVASTPSSPTDAMASTNAAAGVLPPPSPAAFSATTAALSVAIPTPVDAPDFAQSLGVHLSVLAKDGIQRAELHLNPAEMGPVSVQIVMDGTQARIDFGADVAATRHAIEAGLPELASALRDAGFTLAGGGVSQHSGQSGGSGSDRQGADGQATRDLARASGDTVAAVSGAARRIVSRGGLDLYA